MWKSLLMALVLFVVGCGGNSDPVTITPELEAKQKQDEKQVRDEEAAQQKRQRLPRTREQSVNEAEAARQKRR